MTTATADPGAFTVFPIQEDPAIAPPQAPALAPLSPLSTALGNETRTLVQAPPLNTSAPLFSCVQHLNAADRVTAKQRAVALDDGILVHNELLATYGNSVMQPVNELVERLLDEEKPVSLPELEARMRKLRQQMRQIEGHTASADPDVIAFYTKWKARFLGILHHAEGTWILLRDDLKSIKSRINDLELMLKEAQDELLEIIIKKGVYRDDNEREIVNLFGTTAVMELAAIEAADRASKIVIDEHDPLSRARQQRDELDNIAKVLNQRVGRFQARLMIAFTTTVDISGSCNLDIALFTLISDLRLITLPTLRATVWKWMEARKAQIYAGKASAITEFGNDVMAMYGQASVDTAQIVANATETPLFSATTFLGMCAALDQVANVIVAAMQAGERMSIQNRQAITQGLGILDGSQDKVHTETLAEALRRVKTLNADDVIPVDFARKVLAQPVGAAPSITQGDAATVPAAA